MTKTYKIVTLGIINVFTGSSVIVFSTYATMPIMPFTLIMGTLCATLCYTIYRFAIE